ADAADGGLPAAIGRPATRALHGAEPTSACRAPHRGCHSPQGGEAGLRAPYTEPSRPAHAAPRTGVAPRPEREPPSCTGSAYRPVQGTKRAEPLALPESPRGR